MIMVKDTAKIGTEDLTWSGDKPTSTAGEQQKNYSMTKKRSNSHSQPIFNDVQPKTTVT